MLAFVILGEASGRALGLHTPVLYEKTSYGYRVAPDQDIRRFGHRNFYNAQGLRSESVATLTLSGTRRVLCLGDSIFNGGAVTDQADTIPYQLESSLQRSGVNAQILNASAPGWAIGNSLGWLQSNGVYGSELVILQIGTLDLSQPMATADLLDHHPSFPSRRPPFALHEFWNRYVLPRIFRFNADDPGANQGASVAMMPVKDVETMISEARNRLTVSGARFLVVFVDLPDGKRGPGADPERVIDRFMGRMQEVRIPVIRPASLLRGNYGEALFRDGLHPNAQGNRNIARALAAELIRLAILQAPVPVGRGASNGPGPTR